jgi:hypothetical protein
LLPACRLYLRFFQQQPDTALKGDPSDDFAFSSFFPDALRPPIDALAGACSTLTRLRHVPGSAANGEASRLIGAGSGAIKSVGSAGADVTADSHRRRCVGPAVGSWPAADPATHGVPSRALPLGRLGGLNACGAS